MPEPTTTAIVESVTKVIGAILSPRVAVSVFVVACILLAVPAVLAGRLPWLDASIRDHRATLVLTMLISGVFSGTYVVTYVWSAGQDWNKKRIRLKGLYARLGALTLREKHILQEFIEKDSRTANFNTVDGDPVSLVGSGILSLRQMYGTRGTYLISDAAWEYLMVHRELIATPNDPMPPRSFMGEY